MAQEVKPWKDAIDSALARNKTRNGAPSSVRRLATTLAALHGSTQKEESWRRTINKVRAGDAPTERQATLIAAALDVSRETLPEAASRMSLRQREALLLELEETVAVVLEEQKDLDARIAALEARAGRPAGAPKGRPAKGA